MSEEIPANLSPEATITSGRVQLSSPRVDVLMEWATGNDEVSHFCTLDIRALRDQVMACLMNDAIPRPWLQLIFTGDTDIGLIYVTPNSGNYDKCRAEVGFCLHKNYLAEGIVYRTLKGAIPTMFQQWPGLERLEAKVEVTDWAARRTLERVGFLMEGILMKYRILEGRTVDVAMYRFLASDLRFCFL